MIGRDLFRLMAGQGEGDLAEERLVPCLVRASGTGEDEAAILKILPEVHAFGFLQDEIILTGEDAEWRGEDFLRTEGDLRERRGDVESGLVGGFLEEGIGETNGCLVLAVAEI